MNTSKRENPLPVESIHSALKITGCGAVLAGVLAVALGDYLGNQEVDLWQFLTFTGVSAGALFIDEIRNLQKTFTLQYGESTLDPLDEWESV